MHFTLMFVCHVHAFCSDTLGNGGRRSQERHGRVAALLVEFQRLEQALKNMKEVELKVQNVRPAGGV